MRIFNTYGSRMDVGDGRVVSNFIVQALKGKDITIYGDDSQTRSFCYVDDLIEGMIRLMNSRDESLGPVNIGNPGEFTIRQLAEMFIRLTNSSSKLIYNELPADDPRQRNYCKKGVIKLLERDITTKINWVLDNICPPILRDIKWIMYPIYFMAYGKKTNELLEFKDNYKNLKWGRYCEYYRMVGKTSISKRKTDLNNRCINQIIKLIKEKDEILDVGCGRGYLCGLLKREGYRRVTGIDLFPPDNRDVGFSFVEGYVEELPFKDMSFDTVICAHVLEHIGDVNKALLELYRVTRRQIVIVIPCQREYRWLADLHLNFFPYEYSVLKIIPQEWKDKYTVNKLGGDWFIKISRK